MKIYDSKQKQKLEFIPIVEKQARIYVCGPTVYDDAHLGHARSSIVFDLLWRVLEANGYEVTFVKNFTDIDDKIIKKALQSNMDLESLTQNYIDSYLSDMQALGVRRPSLEPRATESLSSIAEMIQRLLDKQIAYKTSNGDIYLDVSKDEFYGSLSHRGGSEDLNISRVENNEIKQDQKDFALWKAYKGEGDIGYESTLGNGRPGWHIECSAMIESTLAYKDKPYHIDIHGGGADLLFPHHENEASQTRCASGSEISKYWMHNGFVNINGEKMSKSLGNSFFVKDALKSYDGEILRNYLLSTHYRSILNFNEEDLLMSKKRLDKLYRLKKRVLIESDKQMQAGEEFKKDLLESLGDDLNISKALSIIEIMLNEANQELDKNPKNKIYKQTIMGNIHFISEVLGIGIKNPIEYFQQGVDEESKKFIEEKIKQRLEAKKNKDYALSDKIRDELSQRGIMIMDTPNGTVWEKVD